MYLKIFKKWVLCKINSRLKFAFFSFYILCCFMYIINNLPLNLTLCHEFYIFFNIQKCFRHILFVWIFCTHSVTNLETCIQGECCWPAFSCNSETQRREAVLKFWFPKFIAGCGLSPLVLCLESSSTMGWRSPFTISLSEPDTLT